MASSKNSVETLLNLNRIPKTREAIEYVRERLSENKSEEAKSFIEKILELYHTSPGFNALQLSKVRIKRMKAAHYREMLLSLDEELKSILDNHLLGNNPTSNNERVKETLKLSNDLSEHPTYSMLDEADDFERLIEKNNEPELILYLLRKNSGFYLKATDKNNFDELISKYEQFFIKAKNNYLKTRYEFELHVLEHEYNTGFSNPSKVETLFKQFEALLMEESDESLKRELLLNIIRCGALLPDSYHLLRTYIEAAVELVNENNSTDQSLNLYFAKYAINLTLEARLKLLDKYESSVSEEDTATKANIKIAKGEINLHFGQFDEAKKSFNAAEHLIFKTSWKNNDRRIAWNKISYWRKFIFAEMILSNHSMYQPAMFGDLEKIIKDNSSQQGGYQWLCETEALKLFLSCDWSGAKSKYESANQYYDAPYYPSDYYFNQAMLCILEEKSENKAIQKLKSFEAVYFSAIGPELLKKAKEFYKKNKKNEKKENVDAYNSNYHH